MPHTLPQDTTQNLLVSPVVHPETSTGPVGYTAGQDLPATHHDDESPVVSRPQTPSAHPHHHKLTQEEEMRRNILSQVKHAQDATRAGREDEAHRRESRSRSRARAEGSREGSRSGSLAREGGSTSRSGSRAREFIHKVFGSREGSREPSRERPAVTKVDGQGMESSSGDIVGPTLLHAKHI